MKTLMEKMRKNREAADKRARYKASLKTMAEAWAREEEYYRRLNEMNEQTALMVKRGQRKATSFWQRLMTGTFSA